MVFGCANSVATLFVCTPAVMLCKSFRVLAFAGISGTGILKRKFKLNRTL